MKIYNKELPEKTLDKLVNSVKTGKYKEINESIIKKEILKEIKNYPSIIEKISKKKTYNLFIKNIKRNLYKGIGIFNKKTSLKEHFSTKDRDYKIYKKLFFKLKINSIVDLGSGLNPLSYKELGIKPKYTAYEINEEYVKQINNFFKENKINGKAYAKDLLQIKRFPKADLYFLFKLLDSIEQKKGHKLSEELITKIPSKNIIVSFPTKTISGKPMNVPERRWMNLMLDRLNYNYKIIKEENEIFYIISKSS